MKPIFWASCLLAVASPVLAQSVGRLPQAPPSAELARRNLPDLIGFRINGGTRPQYRTGMDLDITSPTFTAVGPRARIELLFTLENRRVVIQPQAQLDGRIIAHLPADLYAVAQPVTMTVTLGDQVEINRSGAFVPEIAAVPDAVVDAGLTIICSTMCLTWPISRDTRPNWVSHTQIYDSVERTAPIGEEVGGRWAVGQTTYLITSRRLKDQFRFTTLRFASPSISGGCPRNADENVWLYPGIPLPLPQTSDNPRQLEVYARSNVTHCRLRGRNNLDATHFVYTKMNVEVAIEGPKGVDPWQ